MDINQESKSQRLESVVLIALCKKNDPDDAFQNPALGSASEFRLLPQPVGVMRKGLG